MPHPFDSLTPEDLRFPDSAKWSQFPPEVLPLWVADMDFPVAPAIQGALLERVRGGLGYAPYGRETHVHERLAAHLGGMGIGGLTPDRVMLLPGVVPGLYASVLGLTSPGDAVMTHVPIYPPFMGAIRDHGRVPQLVPLARGADGWGLDLDAMEAAVTLNTRVLMLCNPHNPSGRVWTRAELQAVADFALRHRLWVVTDELHADLTLDGTFVPFAGLGGEVAARTVTLTGPCKAFNTAGLGIGAAASENLELIARMKAASVGVMGSSSVLAHTMWMAALDGGGEWLADTREYLRANRDFIEGFVRDRLPGVKFVPPQATYLAWLDFAALDLPSPAGEWLLEHAKVALNAGETFGPGYETYARLNFATSRAILAEALERIERAVREQRVLEEH